MGYITPAFSGAQERAEWLRNPCILGGPPEKGTKTELATSPLDSRGPESGRNCDVTPAFSGLPKKGGRNQNWLHHPCLLGGLKMGGIAT